MLDSLNENVENGTADVNAPVKKFQRFQMLNSICKIFSIFVLKQNGQANLFVAEIITTYYLTSIWLIFRRSQ